MVTGDKKHSEEDENDNEDKAGANDGGFM